MADRPPIIRRRRTGVYSVVERDTGTLICSVHASKLEVVGWSGAMIRLVPVP